MNNLTVGNRTNLDSILKVDIDTPKAFRGLQLDSVITVAVKETSKYRSGLLAVYKVKVLNRFSIFDTLYILGGIVDAGIYSSKQDSYIECDNERYMDYFSIFTGDVFNSHEGNIDYSGSAKHILITIRKEQALVPKKKVLDKDEFIIS